MFESKAGVFLIAGLGFFGLSMLVMAVLPWTIYRNEPILTVEELVERDGISPDFVDLAERWPEQFTEHYGAVTATSYAEALRIGHKAYVSEACWHCHSQQVRSVSREEQRWGAVSNALEYQNELQRPVLFGTRRVGPDLIREGGRRSNDWHAAHFYEPKSVVPVSVMPNYPWYFDDDGYPNKRGMGLIAYVQWLGSWLDEYPYYRGDGPLGPQPSKAKPETSTEADTSAADAAHAIEGVVTDKAVTR